VESRVFLDADLYELGSFYEVFEHNYRNIVDEFLTVFTMSEIKQGRIAWYESMLARDRIFHISSDREERARANMVRHIEVLQNELKANTNN
jgi:predicted metal-dependent HD superfamily phosphohydrolase